MNETDNFMQVEEDELAKYEKKKARAIRLLKNIPQDGPIEISYSGGKDSDVILELAKMAGIPFRAIYGLLVYDGKKIYKVRMATKVESSLAMELLHITSVMSRILKPQIFNFRENVELKLIEK